MLGYIAHLNKLVDAAKAERTIPTAAQAKEYISVHDQLQRLFAAMPEKQRCRDWTVAELVPRLQGEFRDHPSAARVAAGLSQLGFVPHRDCSRAGGNARFWRLSQ